MTIRFIDNDRGTPAGKCADVELTFDGGPLDGMKLIGFAVWTRSAGGFNVTMPARQYSVNGERRSFALLRPVEDRAAQDRLRDLIVSAWREHENARDQAVADDARAQGLTAIATPADADAAATMPAPWTPERIETARRDAYANVERHDTPEAAAAAAQAGRPILITDLIPRRSAPVTPIAKTPTPGQSILF